MSGTVFSDYSSVLTKGLALDGKILLTELIGEGAQGQVWRVRELQLTRRDCAAKIFVVPFDLRNSPQVEALKSNFMSEIKNLSALEKQRFTVTLHYIIEVDQEVNGARYYFLALVMELADFGDLGAFMRSHQFSKLGHAGKLQLLRRIAEGLQAAHEYQIFHSDIKPTNVLIFREGTDFIPKLADFGVSVGSTSIAGMRGTPAYMAPEVLNGNTPTSAADIFSLGVLLHEVLTGRHPYEKTINSDLADQVAHYIEELSRQKYDARSLPEEVGGLVPQLASRMLDQSPSRRPNIRTVVHGLLGATAILHMTVPATGSPLHQHKFVWNPVVHWNLDCTRCIFLLHSSHPESDVIFLANRLRSNNVPSFYIRRVLGAHDFILDAWLDLKGRAQVKRVIDAYEAEHRVNTTTEMIIEESRPEATAPPSWRDLRGAALVEYIADHLLQESVEVQFIGLEDVNLVSDLIVHAQNRIRIFLFISASRELEDNEVAYYFDGIAKNARDEVKGGDVECVGVHRVDDNASFLVEFRLKRFHAYAPRFFNLAQKLDQMVFKRARVHFTYRTLVEMDEVGVIESEDGILEQHLAEEFRVRGGDVDSSSGI